MYAVLDEHWASSKKWQVNLFADERYLGVGIAYLVTFVENDVMPVCVQQQVLMYQHSTVCRDQDATWTYYAIHQRSL